MAIQHLFFLVDKSPIIGTGHYVRCCILAKKLVDRKINVGFIFTQTSREDISPLETMSVQCFWIEKTNCVDYHVPILEIIEGNSLSQSILIVDKDDQSVHSETFQKGIVNAGVRLGLFSTTDVYPIYADFLINPNILAHSLNYVTSAITKKMLGPNFMVFRDELSRFEPHQALCRGDKVKLFVSFGGADPAGLTIKVLFALQSIHRQIEELHLVVGSMNPNSEIIVALCNGLRNVVPAKVYIDTPDIFRIMNSCNIAITSPGLTYWELSYLNIPTMMLSGSVREIPIADFLGSEKYTVLLGHFNSMPDEEVLAARISEGISDGVFSIRSAELQKQINVNGADEIVNALLVH